MKAQISIKTVLFIILAVFFVAADRFMDALSLSGFFDTPTPLVGNFFSLSYVKNYYIAFSIPFSGPILSGLIEVIILILLIYWINLFFLAIRATSVSGIFLPLTILILGAMLNFADRLEHGFVIDYFYLKYFTVFNLADIMIVGGIIFIVAASWRSAKI